MMKLIGVAVIGGLCLLGSAEAAELTSGELELTGPRAGEPRSFGWQDREYPGGRFYGVEVGGGDASAAGTNGEAEAAAEAAAADSK